MALLPEQYWKQNAHNCLLQYKADTTSKTLPSNVHPLLSHRNNNNNNDRLTALDPGQPG